METFSPEDFVILVVDDLAQNLQILVEILGKEGYQTSFFRSGKETLEKVKKIQPDLILLDLMMPEIDGLQVCERLKLDPDTQDIPIIFLTASYEQDNLLQAFELGAADYVTKPFTSAELLARVRTHLKLKQQAVKLEEKNQQLQQSEAKLNTIVTYLYDGILIVDKKGIVRFVNPAAARMFNQSKVELLNQEFGIPIMVGTTTEIEIFMPEGKMGLAEITMSETEWKGEAVYLVSLRDISNRREAEIAQQEALQIVEDLRHKLEKLIISDPVTGVYSSRYMLQLAEQEFKNSCEFKDDFSILIIDIDGFKAINKNYGYEIGDLVLQETTKKAKLIIKKFNNFYLGRLGGGHFMILLAKMNQPTARELGKKIQVNCEESFFKINDKIIEIKIGIGVASLQAEDRQFQELLERANADLVRVKNQK